MNFFKKEQETPKLQNKGNSKTKLTSKNENNANTFIKVEGKEHIKYFLKLP